MYHSIGISPRSKFLKRWIKSSWVMALTQTIDDVTLVFM